MRTVTTINGVGAMSLFNLTVQAGDDNEFVVTWRPEGDDTVPDLEGASAEMKAVVEGEELSLSSEGDTILIDEETGSLTVALSDTATSGLPPGAGWYQLRITDGDGLKTTIAHGKFTVLRSLLDA